MFRIFLSSQRESEGNILESGPNNSLKRDLAGFLSRKLRPRVLHLNLPWLPAPLAGPSVWSSVLARCGGTVILYTLLIGHTVRVVLPAVFCHNLCVNNRVLAEPTVGCVFAFPGLHVLHWVQTMLGKPLFLAFQSRGQLNTHLDQCAFLLSRAEERGRCPGTERRHAGRAGRPRRRPHRLPGSAVLIPALSSLAQSAHCALTSHFLTAVCQWLLHSQF